MSTGSFIDDPSTWRHKTPGGVPYRVKERSGSFRWDSTSITEVYIIEAAQLMTFVRESFPLPVLTQGIPQWQARSLPGQLKILSKEISFRSLTEGKPIDPLLADPNAPENTYQDLLEVEITYTDDANQPGSGGVDSDVNDPMTFLEIHCNAGGEIVTFKGPKAKWRDDSKGPAGDTPNTDIDNPISKLVPQIEWSLDWPLLNYDFYKTVMIPRLRDAQGKVNKTAFTILWDCEPETLMLAGWETTEERQALFASEAAQSAYQQNPVRLSVKILEKRIPTDLFVFGSETPLVYGHNHLFNDRLSKWLRMLPDGINPAFELYEFNNLFAASTSG